MPKIRIIPAIAIAIAIAVPVLPRVWAQAGPSAPASTPGLGGPAAAPGLGGPAAAPGLGGPGAMPALGGPAAPGGPAPAPEPPTDAEKFLDEAIKKVAELKSVAAEILQKVDMLGQKFEIKGQYRKAPNDRIYLNLAVSGLPDSDGVMLQVCDGTTFWDYQKVFETKLFRRLDAGPILSKLRTYDLDPSMRDQIINQLGFAGPESLLVGLRKTVRFDQKEKGTLDGRPVWIVRGTWTSREGLLGPNSQPLPPLANLPAYIPSLVSIYLGEEDFWPYKVVLAGQRRTIMEDTRPIGPDGKRMGSKSLIQKPLLTRIELIYTDVKLNTPIPDQEFLFQAPQGVPVEDDTKRILDALEQAASTRAAEKRNEAAKGEGDILNQTIPVPKDGPGGDAPPPIPPR